MKIFPANIKRLIKNLNIGSNLRTRVGSVLGFTLIELLIVMVVLAGLAVVFIVTYPSAQRRARDTKRKNELKQYQAALLNYSNTSGGIYPTGAANLTDLCIALGLSTCPDDPDVLSHYNYQSDAVGSQYIIWASLENETTNWAACSNGMVGAFSSFPSDGDCTISSVFTPTPILPTVPPTLTLTPTLTVVPTLLPTATPAPTSFQLCQTIEAELATLPTNWRQGSDGGRVYIETLSSGDSVQYEIDIPYNSRYQVRGMVYGVNSGSNSFYIVWDDDWVNREDWRYPGTGVWVSDTEKEVFTLSPGIHILELFNRETNSKIDWLEVFPESGCTAGLTSTVTLLPSADSHVEANSPNRNYATDTTLEVDGSPKKIIYMKFDLAGLAGKTIISADLRFRVCRSSGCLSRSTQEIKGVNDIGWTETGLTYNNRPDFSGLIATNNGGSYGEWKQVDITSYVSTKVGQIMSFAIYQSGSDGLDLYSKESSYAPELVIEYTN